MPIAMFVISALLAVQVYAALRAGRITAAGICLGALAFTARNLWNWYRARREEPSPRGHAGEPLPAPPRAPGSALVAFVYPDQLARIGDLLAGVDLAMQDVVVLAIDPLAPSTAARSGATLVSAEGLLRERDPRLIGELARLVRSAGRPIALMRAFGPDNALVALDVARELGAARVVALRAEDASAEAQRTRCTAVWGTLPSPRPALRVDLIAGDGGASVTLDLAPDGAPLRASSTA
jgi:hypothetical protein